MFIRKVLRAFTLIELLLVVAIIGILVSILMPALSKARDATKKAACTSNLRQMGIAVYAYGNDEDEIVAVNFFINSVSTKPLWANGQPLGNFNDGEAGYLAYYLGENSAAYNCPGSEHADGFGDWNVFTSNQGSYTGFTDYRYMARRMENNFINGPAWDTTYGWNNVSMTPLLLDPVIDTSIWGAGSPWDNTASVIHNNRGTLPILILDGRVHQFNRTKYPKIWPYWVWDYKGIMDDLLGQVN